MADTSEECFKFALSFVEDADDAEELAASIEVVISDFLSVAQNRAEEAYERHLESLRDSGGPDDSAYRREMQEAGRGHLLR